MSGEIKRYSLKELGEFYNDGMDSSIQYYEASEVQKLEAEVEELKFQLKRRWELHDFQNKCILEDKEENNKLREELAEMREATRWRDVEKELPEEGFNVVAKVFGQDLIVYYNVEYESFMEDGEPIPMHAVKSWKYVELPKAKQEGAE